jgi:hypothetical protein
MGKRVMFSALSAHSVCHCSILASSPASTCLQLVQQALKRREAVGVELYGFQQSLAKLQLTLERSQETYNAISQRRQQVGDESQRLGDGCSQHGSAMEQCSVGQ